MAGVPESQLAASAKLAFKSLDESTLDVMSDAELVDAARCLEYYRTIVAINKRAIEDERAKRRREAHAAKKAKAKAKAKADSEAKAEARAKAIADAVDKAGRKIVVGADGKRRIKL